jgi:hypothetical protein
MSRRASHVVIPLWQHRLFKDPMASLFVFQKNMLDGNELAPFEECCTSRSHVFVRQPSVVAVPFFG